MFDLGRFIWHLLAGNRAGLGGDAVPTSKWFAAFVRHQIHCVVGNKCVAVFDIVEIPQHRLGRVDFAVGAEVPLQVADP
ncbi:hypothetical protein D3C84_900590 [compost metagenome]